MKNEYKVAVRIYGYYTLSVKASNVDEAYNKACEDIDESYCKILEAIGKVKLPFTEGGCDINWIEDPTEKRHYFD